MSIGSEIKKAYRKSGLRNIYEKNKSLALGALTLGAGPLAAGTLAPVLGLREKQKDAQRKVQSSINEQQSFKDGANSQLDDLIGNIRGGEPQTSIPGGDRNFPVLPRSNGGIVQTGGQASTDQNRLLAEAELQRQMGNDFASTQATSRDQMLREYADLISQQQNRILDENAPGLYEDLNTRGLLRSSELGNALGRERAKAASILQEQVGLQGLQDRQANLGELQGVQNQYQQGRYGAIQRGMSLEDFARQVEAAKLTGQALAPIQQPTPSTKGATGVQGALGGGTIGANFGPTGAIIGAGAGLLGGGLLGNTKG